MGKRVLRNYDSDGNLVSLECRKCHEVKVVSEFSKDKSKKDGVNTMCKECKKQYYRENDGKERERQKKSIRAYDNDGNLISLECGTCHEIKAVSEFSKHKSKKDGVQTICKDCEKEYRNQNKDKKAEYDKQYQKERYDSKTEQALTEIKAYVEQNPQRYNYNPNEEIYGIIYLVHNVKSDKYYVGQTINSFDIRYKSGWLYEHSCKDAVREDLELYGEDSFEYMKIFKVAHTQQDLDRLEAYYIDYFNAYENGYNEKRGNIFTERK